MDVLFIDKLNILGSSVISAKYLHMVGLDGSAFFNNPLVGVGKGFREETLPLAVGKSIIIQKFQLLTQVGNQTFFIMDGKVFISLCSQRVIIVVQAASFRRINSFSRAASL